MRIIRLLMIGLLVLAILGGTSIFLTRPASAAATLVVTTTSDSGDDAAIGASLAADTGDGSGLSIREAIYWAGTGDTITFNSALSGQTITLNSSRLDITGKIITIDGDLNADNTPDITISGNDTFTVIYTVNLTPVAVLNGLAITHGSAINGGGIINDTSSPTISYCVFSYNSASSYGGAMYNTLKSSPFITHCTFSNNTNTAGSGGAINNNNSSPTITDCAFSNNSAASSGGAIINWGGSISKYPSPVIDSCSFTANSAGAGGAIYNSQYTAPVITGSTFLNNSAGSNQSGGAILSYYSSPAITGCVFSGNQVGGASGRGGAVGFNSAYSSTVKNCLFFNNSAAYGAGADIYVCGTNVISFINDTFSYNTGTSGGGVFRLSSNVTLTNSILWGDTASEIAGSGTGTTTVTYSDIQGGYAGTGNLDIDPLFVDAAGGDLHLQSTGGHWTSGGWVPDAGNSPCINAGDPASDYSNEPEPNGGRINMGAFGNTSQASKTPSTSLVVSEASGSYGGTVDLSATLTSGGSGVSGKSVSFTLNGAPAGSGVTDGSGVATVSGAGLGTISAGTYPYRGRS